MAKDEETKVGLQQLDDEALARIVEADLENHQQLKTHEAFAAFAELERRTPE